MQAFKKRNDDARRKIQQLQEQATTVDFATYRSSLKNQAIVDEIEKRFKAFKPSTYDVSRQLKAIEAFEVEAVKNAEATKQAVDLELKDLAATLKNIEEARPFADLTVVCPVVINEPSEEPGLKILNRTKLPLPRSPLMRRLPSSSPRADGWCPDTRYVSIEASADRCGSMLMLSIGEVRRPCLGVIISRFTLLPELFPLCTLAL